jgi:HlyD family secretion protein
LDNARNAHKIALTNLEVVRRQYTLTRAGAWSYDVQNQERQYLALTKAYAASAALLDKYSIRSPTDGVVRSVQASVGSYVSPQGAYDSYTQGMDPLIIMGTADDRLQVRVFVDEILIHRLSVGGKLNAEMFIRGTDTHLPLTFTRIQPYVSPKIELSDARTERVDLRVLPLIFQFARPAQLSLYPGQLVDVYVNEK